MLIMMSLSVPHMRLLPALCFLIALFMGGASLSDARTSSLQCNGKIVTLGATRYEVRIKCGEPASKDTRIEKRISRDCHRDAFNFRERDCREQVLVEDYVEIEEWIYNPGPTGLLRFLTFENGRLIHIEFGGYGF
jgi:hypothetical protein